MQTLLWNAAKNPGFQDVFFKALEGENMKNMKNILMACAALAGAAYAAIPYDTLLLRKGNTWVYSFSTSMSSIPSSEYEGTRRFVLDSVRVFTDTVKFRVVQVDTGMSYLRGIPSNGGFINGDTTRSSAIDTAWYAFPSPSNTASIPLFLLGKSLSASNGRYVYRGDTLRSRKDESNDC